MSYITFASSEAFVLNDCAFYGVCERVRSDTSVWVSWDAVVCSTHSSHTVGSSIALDRLVTCRTARNLENSFLPTLLCRCLRFPGDVTTGRRPAELLLLLLAYTFDARSLLCGA